MDIVDCIWLRLSYSLFIIYMQIVELRKSIALKVRNLFYLSR